MAMSKLGDMPLQFLDIEQYFKCLDFSLLATDRIHLAKAVLLSTCRSTAFALIETLVAPTDATCDAVTYDVIRNSVLNHLHPRILLHYEHHQLHSMTQNNDSISTFVQRLKEQANKCNFGELHDELILSHFLLGLSDNTLCAKLLSTTDLTLDAAVCQAALHKSITSASTCSENSNLCHKYFQSSIPPHLACSDTLPYGDVGAGKLSSASTSLCFSCGSHAFIDIQTVSSGGSVCHLCGKRGHISPVCHLSSSNTISPTGYSTSSAAEDIGATSDAVVLSLYLNKDNLWCESCCIRAATMDFLIDTGSQVTILPATLACANQLSIGPAPPQLLCAYSGGQVDIISRISNAKIFLGNISHQGNILMTTDSLKPHPQHGLSA